MIINVKILKAFAKDGHGGNPAGVVENENRLKAYEKQKISSDIGVSETVFINRVKDGLFDVTFFTPNKEVDLCGHGTIAAFQALLNEGAISEGKYQQKTKAGRLDIIVTEEKEIFMEQNAPKFYEIIENRELIAESLGISVNDLLDLPLQIVSTGLKDLMIGVKNNEILNTLAPDFVKISEISKQYDVTGYHVFSLETTGEEQANCRNFAPYYAIDEEGATGTASGALASYLYHYQQLDEAVLDHILFYQGEKMGVHSAIKVKLKVNGKDIQKVFVGGNAGLDGIRRVEI
jgi:PhzF family phenazine biosynthesis protein